MPRWFSSVSATSARPVRAADPWRSMFSEDGGVGTVSSSVGRTRSSRGVLAGREGWPGSADGRAFAIFRGAARRTAGLFVAWAVLAAPGFADSTGFRPLAAALRVVRRLAAAGRRAPFGRSFALGRLTDRCGAGRDGADPARFAPGVAFPLTFLSLYP